MDQLGLNLGYILVQILNFGIIMVVVYAWVLKPIFRVIQERQEALAQSMEDSRIASEARARAEEEAKKIVGEAHQRADKIVQEATERAERTALDLRHTATAEAQAERESMMKEMERERDDVLFKLRHQVSVLAIAAAHRLIQESLIQDEARQHALLKEFFSGIRDKKLVVLDGRAEKGSFVQVVSALPLEPDEIEIIENNLKEQIQGEFEVQYEVDPSILGGVIVKIGDHVINGSVAGQLEDLYRGLK
ncbi:MAG: F0F1 ATP synthase subunit B [Chloroflexi bacterium]|nr:F0F1 ATP synthase subunit B [Chloroflexota bacterium]